MNNISMKIKMMKWKIVFCIPNNSLKLWWVFQFYVYKWYDIAFDTALEHSNSSIKPSWKKQSQYVNLFSWLVGISCKNTP